MANRQYLYSRFENYDKPDEQDFRDFIDAALEKITFTELIVPVNIDLITDINTIPITMITHEVIVVKYGFEIYLLSAIEGDYGSGGTPVISSMLTLLGTIGAPILQNDLEVNTACNGIPAGYTFPAGTPLEDIMRMALITNRAYNLRYEANTQASIIEIGQSLDITKFTWSVEGTPINLILSDGINFTDAVSGTEHIKTVSYAPNAPTTITWVLQYGSSSTNRSVQFLHPSFSGKKLTKVLPDASEILAGSKVLTETHNSITVILNTTNTEIGWVAVPKAQTGGDYTAWYISELNKSSIGPNEFIFNAGDVAVNSVVYTVYMYNYTSKVEHLKLL